MNRRHFMLNAAGLAAASFPGLAFAQAPDVKTRAAMIAGWRQRIESLLSRGRVPLIDMQATYVAGTTNVARMVEWMDRFDVAQIAFAPANSPNGQAGLDLHRRHPQHFIPSTSSGEFPRWWTNPTAFLSVVREDLKSGQYFLMGEHEFRHYPSPEQVDAGLTFRDITIPIDGPVGHALFSIAEETGVSFQLHYEIEDRLLAPLEDMLARYPKANVIWCHLGMVRYPDRAKRYNVEYVRSLIARFPGLHFDLAVPPPESIYRPSGARDSTLYANGRLAPQWQALLEQHPDRFLAASDYRPPVEQNYPLQIGRQRDLILSALGEKARHDVAYRNAWRLITGTPWA